MGKLKKEAFFLMVFSLCCLVFIQRLSQEYYPVMDDWFLYGDLYKNKMDFIIPNEKLTIRPAAGLFDMFIIAPLYNHLWIAQCIMSGILIAGTLLCLYMMRRYDFGTGGGFLLAVCLLPLNMEATYWIAASVRIVCSVFFIGLSVLLLQKYFDSAKKRFLIFYFFSGFLTVGFYEPAVAVYVYSGVCLILKNKKNPALALILLLHASAIAIYYILNKSSVNLEVRGRLLTSGFWEHTKLISKCIQEILGHINIKILVFGLREKAVSRCMTAVTAVCSVVFGISSSIWRNKNKFSIKKTASALGLCIAGAAVFYVLEDTRFTIRAVFFLIIGLSTVISELFNMIPKKTGKVLSAIILSISSFICTISGAGITVQYKDVSERDFNISKQILQLDKSQALNKKDGRIYLMNSVMYYSDVKCTGWYENIRGACSSEGDMRGCIWHTGGVRPEGKLIPVKNEESAYISEGVFMGLTEDYKVIGLLCKSVEYGYVLNSYDGQEFGRLINDENGKYKFYKSYKK